MEIAQKRSQSRTARRLFEVFEEPRKPLGQLTIKYEAAHQLAQKTEFGLVTVFDNDASGSIGTVQAKPSKSVGRWGALRPNQS